MFLVFATNSSTRSLEQLGPRSFRHTTKSLHFQNGRHVLGSFDNLHGAGPPAQALTLLALEQNAFSLWGPSLPMFFCFRFRRSGRAYFCAPLPTSFLSFVSICSCSVSGFRLGIHLKHIYNGPGAWNLFLVMTDKSSPPKVGARGMGRKSYRLFKGSVT